MGLLQYTSNEMFSATELVRKNKNIFDKLNKKEIQKAIILRDGKPNVILLDFTEYERIMNEYLKLKDIINNKNISIENKNSPNLNINPKSENLQITEDVNKDEFSSNTRTVKDKEEALKEFWD